jgi:hypothetical protein
MLAYLSKVKLTTMFSMFEVTTEIYVQQICYYKIIPRLDGV